MAATTTKACNIRMYNISKDDLPLSCPMPEQELWNAHPRVFLALQDNRAVCPYCGTKYVLQD